MKLYYGRIRRPVEIPPLDALSYEEEEWGGVSWARIRALAEPGKRRGVFFFERLSNGDLLLDWESAVGFSEVQLTEFSDSPPARPVEMRVLLRPSDYYNFEFTDQDSLACYELSDLEESAKVYGYAMRDSDVAVKLEELTTAGGTLRWTQAVLLVRMEDFSVSRVPAQVWIQKVVTKGWLTP
jgi:hypothetical protein